MVKLCQLATLFFCVMMTLHTFYRIAEQVSLITDVTEIFSSVLKQRRSSNFHCGSFPTFSSV